MADSSYYAKRKAESDKKIQDALNARKARTSNAESSLAKRKEESDSKISNALAARTQRVQSSLPDIFADINKALTMEIDSYSSTKPTYGAYDDTYKAQRERRINISNLRSKVNAYRKHIGDDEADRILSSLEQMEKGYDGYLYMAKYDSEDAYKMNHMSAAEIGAKMEEQKSVEEDKAIIEELLRSNMPYNREYAEQDGRDIGIYDEVERKRNYISEKYGIQFTESSYENNQLLTNLLNKTTEGSSVAYTTADGRNVSWQALYDQAVAAEDLATRLDTYSKNADWGELSKGKDFSSDPNRQSDYDLVWELSRSNVAYDKETALANGTSETDWNDIEQKRRYIEEKYGVDLHADIYANVNIFNEIMKMLDDKSWENGELSAQLGEAIIGEQTFKNMRHLNEDEKAVLNYIFYSQGRDAALEWHNSRMDVYQNRANGVLTEEMSNLGKESPFWGSVGSVALSLGSGFEQVGDWLTGDNNNTLARASSAIRSGVSENTDWMIGNWDAFDFVYNTTMSGADSFVASALPGGSVLLGLSAAGQATNDALDRGMSKKQAFWTGLASGVFEGLFERWSIGNFNALKEVASAHGKDIAKNIAKSMLVNASEETLTEIANIAYDSIVNGDFSQYETLVRQYVVSGMTEEEAKEKAALDLGGQVFEAGASGALMGFGFGSVGSAGPTVHNAKTSIQSAKQTNAFAKGVMEVNGGVDALRNLANDVAGVSSPKMQNKLTKLSGKVENKATTRNVGKLYNAVKSANNAQNKSDIATILEMNKFDSKEANAIADAVVALANGDQLTTEQVSLIKAYKNNGVVQDLFSNFAPDDRSIIGKRTQQMEDFDKEIALTLMAKKNGVERTVGDGSTIFDVATKKAISEELAPKGEFKVSDSTKAIRTDTNEEIDIKKVSAVNKGALLLELADGTTIDAKNVSFASHSDALIYEAIADLGDRINAETANKLLSKYSGENAEVFARGMKQAYLYGFYGFDKSELSGKTFLTSEMTEEQRNYAYGLGEKYRPVKDAEDRFHKRIKAKEEKGVYYRDKDGNATSIDTYLKESNLTLNARQKTGIEVMRKFSEMMGTRFNVFETWEENGEKYYLDEDGVKQKGNPNGFYDPKTGTIYIALDAGATELNKFRDTMLFTIAHEMTHFMKDWSPEHFTKISKIIFKQAGFNGHINELVTDKMAARKKSGKPISYDTAVEEVVADAMETILKDGKVAEFMADVKKKDNVAWQKLKGWFKKLAKFLRNVANVYRGETANTIEGKMVSEFAEDLLRQIEQIWAEGAVAAGENYQNAQVQKNTTEDGGVRMMVRENVVDVNGKVYRKVVKPGLTIYEKVKHSKKSYVSYLQSKIYPRTFNLPSEEGSSITVEFAKGNERVKKDGDKTPRRVLGELEATADRLKMIAIINIRDLLKNSEPLTPSNENSHQWLDDGGWRDRISYMMDNDVVYPVILHIPKTRDGRYLLYDVSVIKDEGSTVDIDATALASSSDGRASTTHENESKPAVKTIEPSDERLAQPGTVVKNELEKSGIGFDEESKTVFALRDSTAYKDILTVGRKKFDTEAIAQLVANGTGRSIEDARKWVNSELTIANLVMANPEFLDFDPDERYDAIKKNSDYPQGTVDLSNLCPKREEFTSMFDMLQKKYPNKLFTAQDVADMRKILSNAGITVACGACFVEDRRQLVGEIADTYINMWKEAVETGKPLQKTNSAGVKSDLLVTRALAKQYGLTPGSKIMATDTYIPNQYDLTTYEGFKLLEKNHPTIAMGFNRYNNSRGQQSARLIEGRAEYKRQILGWSDAKVRSVNNNGGLRIFSFSDFEVVHLLDLVQVIIDCAAKGVKIQGYTKIPAFARLVRSTGIKLNRSHIPKGDYGYHMENGKVVLDCDTTEGINTNDENFVDEDDNPDVGDVIIGINPTQIAAAMLDPFFDYIIPFHSNKAKEILRKLGTGEWVNYKESQHEKDIATGTSSKHNVNIYTEVINKYHPKNKVEFVEAFLKECKRQGKIPRYAEFLNVDANGDYAYREGYHKLLVDFKMFDKDGNILPQGNIAPNLDEAFMKDLLSAEVDKKQNYEFPQEVYDAIDEKFGEHSAKLSDRDNAPTFYSHMARVVEGLKDGKYGASSVISMLRDPKRGVKAEEIKWSGIETFLEGKKSVSKAELQEFIAGSMLQIEEEILDNKDRPYTEDQQKRLDEYEAKRDEVAKRLADEWKKITGDEFPIRNAGAGLESSVVNKIIDANKEHKDASFEGRLLAKLRKDVQKVIENNDDFGFDSWKDALRSIHRHRRDFIPHYEMSTNDKAVIVKYCNALNAYNEMPNKISDADTEKLRAIARETDPWNRKIMEVKHEHNEEEAKYMTNWKEYSLKGGKNYREMLFRIPGSTYSNAAMFGHWNGREGVLAHARIQDMDTANGRMLFVEEIQSDWHNEGHKEGYRKEGEKTDLMLRRESQKAYEEFYTAVEKMLEVNANWEDDNAIYYAHPVVVAEMFEGNESHFEEYGFTDEQIETIRSMVAEETARQEALKTAPKHDTAPDAPFKDTYHEYVLKRLIRMAAEEGYDIIGWTPSATQMDRWNPDRKTNAELGITDAKNPDAVAFEEAYRNVYDRRVKKYLESFGEKWGATVGKTTLDNGTEVWSMDVTDSMKESVLTEGQPLYSDRILMGSLFSGGGTLEAGLVYQMLDKEFAVEYKASLAATYADNHGKDHLFVGDVRDFDSKNKQNVFYLHASPVCKNFSPASHSGGETTDDITTAQATVRVLEEQMPQVFTVENVKRYIGSEAYNIITDKLTELGYKWDVDVYKASDYGNATKRDRMIIRAVKEGQLPAKPAKASSITSWGEATRDLWETDLIPSTLVKSKIEAIRNTPKLKNLKLTKLDKPLMIYDTNKSKQAIFAWADELAPTLTTKCGDARIIMPDGKVYEPTPKFMGRIQGLPDDYKYPKAKTNAFKIIGNGIPTQLTKAVIGGVLDSAYEQTHEGKVLYQDRAEDSVSNRALLANAFEGIAKPEEKQKIQEYKDKISLIEAEEKKLREINEQIKELSFAKGPRDNKRIKALRFDAVQAANRINTYDKQLLRLEASEPLQKVLNREKKLAYKKAEQRGKEALADYKAKVEAQQKKTTEEWRKSRKTAVAKARETAEKRDARAKLQKLVLDTVKWISYPAKTDVKCPDILKKPYEAFLQGIDLSSKRLANGGEATKNDLRLANAMDSLATAIDKVMLSQDPSQDVDKVLDIGYLDLPADFVQKLRDMTESIKSMMVEGEYVVNTMTAEEVRKLSQMIRTLNHAIKTMSNLYANLRFANVEALGFDTMDFLDAVGEIEKTGGMKDFVQWDNALPYYAFKRFGKGGESIFEGLMDAQDKLAFLAQEIFDFQEKTWTGKEAKAWSEDTHTITLPNGNELTLTTADAMSIYCLSRREQALPHLLGGGVRVMGIQKGSQKAKDSRSLLTIEDVDAIISSLTDRQKQVAEAMQEYMSTVCSEWGNEISMKRFLTREFTEKFYFPIESNDENLTVKDPAAQQSDLFRLLNISATKPLTQGANNEVIVRNIFDVFVGHTSDMARLNAYGMGLLDYMKWLNYREKTTNEAGQINVKGVRKSMETAYGKAANSYVLNLIKDVNGRASDGGDPNILMKWMRAAKTASVGSSLRVATLQITSYPRAALVLSPKSLALGFTKVPNIRKAKKYCGIALWKSFGFYDTNIARSIEDQMKGVTDVKQKLIELSLKGAEWGDAITWGALWNACEYEVAKTTKNKVGSEEFYQEVGKKLREVVYRTQVVDSTLTRSQIMRSKRGMAQEAAAFMSEPTLSANILMDAGFEFDLEKRRNGVKSAWKKTGSYIGRAVAVYSIGQLTAALLEAFWDAWRDDEDEEFGEKYWDAFVQNLILDLLPLNKLPILSDGVDMALAQVNLGFYSSDRMSTTWIAQADSALKAWKKVFEGESSTTVYNALYKTVRAISSFYGVSFSGVMREGVDLWNNFAGGYDSTLKIRQYDLSNASLGTELYEAIISGDTRQADSLKAQFDDEDAMHSAVRKALRENDPRIKEAAEARFSGDFAKYKELFLEIKEEGHFVFDDIMGAINAEVNELEKKANGNSTEETKETDEVEALFKVEHYYQAVVGNDEASAKLIYDDMIAQKIAEGYLRHEAEDAIAEGFATLVGKDYKDGKISSSRALQLLEDNTDKDESEVKKWDFELEHGFTWGSRVRKYRLGKLSKEDLISAVMDIEGESREAAEAYIDFLDLELAHGDIDITANDAEGYFKYAEPAGITVDVYLNYKAQAKQCKGIQDADGKTISGSKKTQLLDVINSLPITSAQKDALYFANGWAESKLYEAPWH